MRQRTSTGVDYASPNWRERLPRLRAEALARLERAGPDLATRRCLIVAAGGEAIAIPIEQVMQVSPYVRPARPPYAHPALLGVAGRTGAFYLVYDLARLLERPAPTAEGGQIVRLRLPGRAAAVRVDRAEDVVDLIVTAADASGAPRLHSAFTSIGRSSEASDHGADAVEADLTARHPIPMLDAAHLFNRAARSVESSRVD